MAILRSLDGQFYEVPDDQVGKFLIPADKVKAKLEGAGVAAEPPGGPPPGGGGGPPPGGPTILVQVFGTPTAGPGAPPPTVGDQAAAPAGAEVQPYGYWNNWWHNVRPGWNNWWHNVHP